jgi:CheY-like chemotaxis protein
MDDHILFTNGPYNLIKPQLGNSFYLRFNEVENALRYMINSIKADEMPNLLITDLSHPGINGYEFALQIRKEERKWRRSRIPIVMLTMHNNDQSLIKLGLQSKIIDCHISKNSDSNVILNVVKSLC